jgi:hypothetical protein
MRGKPPHGKGSAARVSGTRDASPDTQVETHMHANAGAKKRPQFIAHASSSRYRVDVTAKPSSLTGRRAIKVDGCWNARKGVPKD